MNLTNICPDIPDSWRGAAADVCRVLGNGKPVSRQSLATWAARGKRNGGIDWLPSPSGRKIFTGREVKRFWRQRMLGERP